jgi:hypothetical protein
MNRRSIASYTRAEFDAVRQRLGAARDALRAANCRLQSVARAYYVVYLTASYAAGKYGVKAMHWRRGERIADQDFSHAEFSDLVYALYTGCKRGNIFEPGASPGIGSGNYDDRNAYRNCVTLYELRVEADYGPNSAPEPYDKAQIDTWLVMAQRLTQDLETIL